MTRFDPDELVRRVAAAGGPTLVVDGRCPGGEVGAAFVRWPDGRRSVLSFGTLTAPPIVDLVVAAGHPAPRYEAVVDLGGEVVVVQSVADGSAVSHVSTALVDDMLRWLDRRRGLLPHNTPDLYLCGDGPGFCLHGPLRSHGGRALRVCEWVESVGRSVTPPSGGDAVHFDYHPGNVLVSLSDPAVVTAIIDWDGSAAGDGRLDLVTLCFGVRPFDHDPAVARRLDELVCALPDDVRKPLWAHMSLRLVDWGIRFRPEHLEMWLAMAEREID